MRIILQELDTQIYPKKKDMLITILNLKNSYYFSIFV